MTFSYNDFRAVLRRAAFSLVRSGKHETWEKTLADGTILIVRISHQHHRDIPRALFHRMLRQANLSEREFTQILRS